MTHDFDPERRQPWVGVRMAEKLNQLSEEVAVLKVSAINVQEDIAELKASNKEGFAKLEANNNMHYGKLERLVEKLIVEIHDNKVKAEEDLVACKVPVTSELEKLKKEHEKFKTIVSVVSIIIGCLWAVLSLFKDQIIHFLTK